MGLGGTKPHPILTGPLKNAREDLVDLSLEVGEVILVVLKADQEVISLGQEGGTRGVDEDVP